jgi:hypothetical protein
MAKDKDIGKKIIDKKNRVSQDAEPKVEMWKEERKLDLETVLKSYDARKYD